MKLLLDPKSIEDYRKFCQIKRLPSYQIRGRMATIPDHYASRLGLSVDACTQAEIDIPDCMYDYQKAITRMAIEKRKFAIFADCGLGKSLMILTWSRHVFRLIGEHRRVLIFTPPMVIPQMIEEASRFLPETKFERVSADKLSEWLSMPGDAIGITNYEALKDDTPQGCLGAMALDEASILKSHYGNYGGICIRLGRGLEWKITATGTPAPNDRIEYANQAVFLDRFPTINSFLAKYFINRGQTQERWALKAHALKPFYRGLSDWSIFLTNPAVYGWKDNCGTLPPIHTHIEHVSLTEQQQRWVNTHLRSLIATRAGGIQSRGSYGQVAKGYWKGETFESNKPAFIRDLIDKWKHEESTLVWCIYDKEQDGLHKILDGSESLSGTTKIDKRIEAVNRFKSGDSRILISKSQILGFGLNLQVATRQVFSGLQDSYEKFYQCVKRSNRIGSTKPLNVHIPITELEEPMVETVVTKAHRVEDDTREQEELFREQWMQG